jgi:peptidoglycan/LPS O-acetylase OafA/YrhL
MVIAYHAEMYFAIAGSRKLPWNVLDAIFRRLWIGVPLFFVISGYCISATADNQRSRQAGMRDYFKRRFRRIFPPYWAALSFAILMFGCFPALLSSSRPNGVSAFAQPAALSLTDWIGNVSLTQVWLSNVFGRAHSIWDARVFLGPAWTLCYEEQFYAVTGLLLLIPGWFFAGAAGVTAATMISVACHFQPVGVFVNGEWLKFAAGMAVYYALNRASQRSRAVIAVFLVVCVLLLSGHPAALIHSGAHGFRLSLVVSCAFAGLLLLLKRWDVPMSRSRWTFPVSCCGLRCYSIYLVHWPIVKLLTSWAFVSGLTDPWNTFLLIIPLCLICSIGCGWLFHYLVEKQFLNHPLGKPDRTSFAGYAGLEENARTAAAG